MLIKTAEINKYKCIDYSNLIEIENNVTCLVGKNESGKTAALEAIYRINPIPSGHPTEFRGSLEYPRKSVIRDKDNLPSTYPITVTFKLEDNEISDIESEFGQGCLKSPEFEVSKNYENELQTNIEINEKNIIDHLLSINNLESSIANDVKSIEEFKSKLDEMMNPPESIKQLIGFLDQKDICEEITNEVLEMLPDFLYFDEYSIMPGRISIPYLQQTDPNKLEKGERTALSLLRLADVDSKNFTQENYEERKAALEAASNEISKEVFDYWSQNTDLRVEIDADFSAPPKDNKKSPFLETRIRNERHQMSLNFNERSAGFVWFFSFLAFFSEYRNSEKRLVILLDEPGLGLHASAQADLLRFIDEKLAVKHQIIYTTHSPFMVEPTRLDRTRTVEDVIDEGTKISSDILTTTKETVFPLQAAIGYELSQTLFVGPNSLVVEGPSDILYLQILSQHLATLDRQFLDEKWVIVPVGGADKIPTFLALLDTQLNVAAILDVSYSGNQKVDDLVTRGILSTGQIFPLNKYTNTSEADIEDLFTSSFYLQLVKGCGIEDLKGSDLEPGGRIVQRIEKTLGHSYNHYSPSAYFLKNHETLLPKVADSTLDRFERLFEDANKALKG